MAEFNITANDLERMMRMAYLESGSIPAQDRVRDFQQVLGSMLTRGQLFANGMAGEGYGKLRSDQKGNTGYDRTPIQLSLAAGSAYEPLGKFGGDLSKLPDVPQIYRELAAEYFGSVLKNPDVVDLHTDYGNPIVVKQRQGGNWENHWLYGVSQNPDMVNGAGSVNQHAHGTMTGIELPKSFNPGFNGGAQEWINVNQSRDGFKSPEAIQAMLDWAATPDISIGTAGTDGFGDKSNIGDALALGRGGIGANGSVNTGLSTAMGYNAPGAGPGDAFGGGSGSFTDGISDPRVAGSIYINPNTFAGRFAVGDALSAGNGSIGNSGRPVETGNPYAFSSLTPGQAVRDAYENVLGRTATQSELDGWKGMIHPGGLTLGQALDQIAASPEAAARATFTGVDPRTYGVIDAYASQLNRLPEQQGLTSWMQQLSQGASLDSVLNRISNSPEAQRADITNFYQRALQRQADPSGLQAALDQLAGGRSLQAVETSILGSPEAQALGITPDQFSRYFTPDLYSTVGAGPTTGTIGPGSLTGTNGAVGTTPTINPSTDTGTVGPGSLSPTLGAGDGISTLGPGTDTGTVGPGSLTPTVGSGDTVGTLGPGSLTGTVGPGSLTGTVGPGDVTGGVPPTFTQAFDGNAYLQANPDVAAFGMDPLKHYLNYGYGEGRAVDAAGDRLPQGFNSTAYLAANPDVAATGMNPLEHFVRFGAAEGRSLSPTGFSGANVSGGVGNGTFSGTFNGSQYLQANPDVAAAGMDPLTHFIRYGLSEGRALDTQGDHLSQNFDGNAYLAQNRDVALAGMNPLEHYLRYGAAEGRAAPTGDNPYNFSNFNVSQGLGPTGNGAFGLGGITNTAPAVAPTVAPPASSYNPTPFNPFGFSQMDTGTFGSGGFGVPQTNGYVDWESAASNALPGSGGASGSAYSYTDSNGNNQVAVFDPKQSELAYLRGQAAQTNQQIAAGQQGTANNPNLANFNLATMSPTPFLGVNPALAGANPTGIGGGFSNVGTYVAPGTYTGLVAPVTPIAPVLSAGMFGTVGFNGGGVGGTSRLGFV